MCDKWCCFCFQDKPSDAFDKQPKGVFFHACRECAFSLSGYRGKENVYKDLQHKIKASAYLYVIQSVIGGPVKIGISTNFARRFATIQSMSPFKLTAIRLFNKIPHSLEARLHLNLSEHRLHGEWFKEEALQIVDVYMERVFKSVEEAKALGVKVKDII